MLQPSHTGIFTFYIFWHTQRFQGLFAWICLTSVFVSGNQLEPPGGKKPQKNIDGLIFPNPCLCPFNQRINNGGTMVAPRSNRTVSVLCITYTQKLGMRASSPGVTQRRTVEFPGSVTLFASGVSCVDGVLYLGGRQRTFHSQSELGGCIGAKRFSQECSFMFV